jgi:hypothetical protein
LSASDVAPRNVRSVCGLDRPLGGKKKKTARGSAQPFEKARF